MISPYFTKSERDYILDRVKDWNDLRGSGKQRNSNGDLINLKNKFIDDLVGGFFAHFPERDNIQNPRSPDAMPQDDRDRLHTVFCYIFT